MEIGRFLTAWLSFAVISGMFCGLVYAAVQQNERQSANDPQIQLAEDAAAALAAGANASDAVPAGSVDPAKSLSPFVIAYDADGTVLSASGVLDGVPPRPPMGVFASARARGEDRVTWEPRDGVRIAAVIAPYQNAGGSGFVLAGRSLREVEAREDQTMRLAALAWVVSVLFGAVLFAGSSRRRAVAARA